MRLSLALCGLLLAGCAGPHSTGALWAQQNLEREAALFRSTETQRAAQAQEFELTLADEALSAERLRVEEGLQDCPGERRPFALSADDKVRDTIRLRARGDSARLTAVAQVALADWYLRRGSSSGDAGLCDRARSALTSSAAAAPQGDARAGLGDDAHSAATAAPSSSRPNDLFAGLGEATVARNGPRPSTLVSGGDAPLVTLSLYATQVVDGVRAAAPLPQYLAAVYGGQLTDAATPPNLRGQTAEIIETMVDELASTYPEWEPDALYAAFGGVT